MDPCMCQLPLPVVPIESLDATGHPLAGPSQTVPQATLPLPMTGVTTQ